MNPFDPDEPTVFFVGGDPQVIRALRAALRMSGARLEVHATAWGFFKAYDPRQPGCLVWDETGPGPRGEELFCQLAERKIRLPVILVSAAAEAPSIVRAMRAGALNYLEKPPRRETLREAVREALERDAENRARLRRVTRIRRRLSRLTPGEREVLEMLLEGGSNRSMAETLGLSVRTIEVRRGKLMHKMKARSLAELVRMALTVEVPKPEIRSQNARESQNENS